MDVVCLCGKSLDLGRLHEKQRVTSAAAGGGVLAVSTWKLLWLGVTPVDDGQRLFAERDVHDKWHVICPAIIEEAPFHRSLSTAEFIS